MVYVDKFMPGTSRRAPCALFADTLEELKEMSRKIGVRWPRHLDRFKLPYRSIPAKKRESAIEHGAIAVSPREKAQVFDRWRAEAGLS